MLSDLGVGRLKRLPHGPNRHIISVIHLHDLLIDDTRLGTLSVRELVSHLELVVIVVRLGFELYGSIKEQDQLLLLVIFFLNESFLLTLFTFSVTRS